MLFKLETDSDEKENYSSKFFGKLFISLTIVPIFMLIWPSLVPFGFFEFWKCKGTIGQWLISALPVFVWAVGLTIVLHFVKYRDYSKCTLAELFLGGTISSIVAGLFEEIIFRWLFFLASILSVKLANFLLFGFLGFGLPEWLHLHVFGPVANWTTFGYLHDYLFHPSGYAVGAAMLGANAFFRDGHKYQGILGWTNSWFIGLFLFWIMFNYGLLAAIFIHFLYDFLIDVTSSVFYIIQEW